MIKEILHNSRLDEGLSSLLSVAAEYAEIYLLAKNRLKGCDGMGELTTITEEFRDAVDKVIKYCKEKDYPSGDSLYDIDCAAKELSVTVKE
ncbi:MAG: hypothetical protein HZC49_12650 [Nitrospirae bacterium]|nr:hypothetical protein [Nitrospirota bacterium]